MTFLQNFVIHSECWQKAYNTFYRFVCSFFYRKLKKKPTNFAHFPSLRTNYSTLSISPPNSSPDLLNANRLNERGNRKKLKQETAIQNNKIPKKSLIHKYNQKIWIFLCVVQFFIHEIKKIINGNLPDEETARILIFLSLMPFFKCFLISSHSIFKNFFFYCIILPFRNFAISQFRNFVILFFWLKCHLAQINLHK